MAGKKKYLPQYTRCHLADELKRVWKTQGPLKGFLDGSLGKNKPQDLDMCEGMVFIRLYGASQILYFEETKNKHGEPEYTFCVHNLGINSEQREKVTSYIENRVSELSNQGKKKLDEIFDKPQVEAAEITFRNEKLRGILVKVPLKKLPRGKEGHLSNELFMLAHNVYARPSFNVILGLPPPKTWDDFSDKKSDWRKHLV